MKSLATLIKLQKLRVDEHRQILSRLILRLEGIEQEIERHEARVEAEKTTMRDNPDLGMTYGAFVAWALERSRSLEKQRHAAIQAVEKARDQMAEVFEEQKRYELAEAARQEAERREEDKRERAFLDEVGTQSFIRKKRRDG